MARIRLPLPTDWADAPWLAELLQRCAFPSPHVEVDCAVSGGADSLALLVLAAAGGYRPTAHHVDHGLRSSSAAEGVFVATVADALGVPSVLHAAPVDDGPDLEARARRARHAVLPPGVLFGHTLDDQAETVLLALLRGTGPEGVAAMTVERHPLLSLRRADTVALCARLGLEPVEDPSNQDPRFRRNRVRHELVPLMADIAERDVSVLIARFAALQRDEHDAFSALLAGVDPTDCQTLAALEPAARAHVLRHWFRHEARSSYAPDAAATGRMLAVAAGDAPRADVVAGWQISRTAGRLRLERTTDR